MTRTVQMIVMVMMIRMWRVICLTMTMRTTTIVGNPGLVQRIKHQNAFNATLPSQRRSTQSFPLQMFKSTHNNSQENVELPLITSSQN